MKWAYRWMLFCESSVVKYSIWQHAIDAYLQFHCPKDGFFNIRVRRENDSGRTVYKNFSSERLPDVKSEAEQYLAKYADNAEITAIEYIANKKFREAWNEVD